MLALQGGRFQGFGRRSRGLLGVRFRLGGGITLGRRRPGGTRKGIDPASPSASRAAALLPTTSPPLGTLAPPFGTTARATAPTRAGTTPAGGRLGAMERHQLLELAFLQLLAEGAQGKTKHSHRGSQTEGLLQGTGGAHFVVAQPNAKATFPWSGRALSPGGLIGAMAFGGERRGSAFGHAALGDQAQV